LNAVKNCRPPSLFFSALLFIASIGCGQAPSTLAHGKPLDYWLQSLENRDAKTRKKAVQVLGNIGPADSAVIPALCTALKDRDVAVRREAVVALTKLGPKAKDALPALGEVVQDRDSKLRSQADKAIRAIQGEE